MAFNFPANPEHDNTISFEGRVWTFDALRKQWLSAYEDPNKTSIEDIGFVYDVVDEKWHLDVGVMTNV